MDSEFNEIVKKLSGVLKNSPSKEIDKILNNFGISKEEALTKINSIDQKEFLEMINDKLASFPPEEVEKMKKLDINKKGDVENLYKALLKAKEGK